MSGYSGGNSAGWDFVSSAQTYALSSVLSVAHGLGAVPSEADVLHECVTANNGYAVGDQVSIGEHSQGTAGCVIYSDATNVNVYVGIGLYVLSRSSGDQVTPTISNWKLVIRARR